jgi:hypothetical protein
MITDQIEDYPVEVLSVYILVHRSGQEEGAIRIWIIMCLF